MKSFRKKFNLTNKIIFITGGAGLLGKNHAEAVAELGAIPILFDKNYSKARVVSNQIKKKYNTNCESIKGDITSINSVKIAVKRVIKKYKKIDVLINNAANDSVVTNNNQAYSLEKLSLLKWKQDISVGLTGAFICTQIIGSIMAKQGSGVIVNVSSDLGIIAPDQRIYITNHKKKNHFTKPISYSVVKHGIIGLSKYVATYWGDRGVRSNTICPGGVYNNQPKNFVKKVKKLIPLNRMAKPDEYKSAIQFLCSDASAYMNGSYLILDGGRSIW